MSKKWEKAHRWRRCCESVYVEAAAAVSGLLPPSFLHPSSRSALPAGPRWLVGGASQPPWRPLPVFCPPIANDALFSPWHPSPAAVLGAVSPSPSRRRTADSGAPHGRNGKLSPAHPGPPSLKPWARSGPPKGHLRVRARGFTHFSQPRISGQNRTLGEISLKK